MCIGRRTRQVIIINISFAYGSYIHAPRYDNNVCGFYVDFEHTFGSYRHVCVTVESTHRHTDASHMSHEPYSMYYSNRRLVAVDGDGDSGS